ncbi:phenylalanine--tRNA ligase subunit beta [Campylobacter vulpis]|uniref:Phenylalanine--tRNA ligase beta subunit n=1 Tax=Campylobacter vulpis TaxID=1655500 RepID=A0A2G4QZA7_9BACT|nr:phenylalanine--tRNA ligase subunit beta [Campylobacter vulpis]MBS4330689.1 phenylalanine--tRNA ligase subunit beta [Campylobacter vulpis]MBS4438790.1 phenylalanine--tRNA ligase subunit beta [Campylobacter vulpis]PHY89630.1 phenylalanyl-tRNA synthetase subunit beta [Campylobacter vulpis]
MIITRTWLSEWVNIDDKNLELLVKTLNSIGLEVDKAYSLKAPNNVVVGLVVEKEKHENAEKLSVCKVDIGTEILQIVCGAANVAQNQFVAVALNGAKMPNGLEIKKAKLRGVESNGMLCSSVELGFGKTNEGILVLDESMGELELGRELNSYNIFNDELIEIELTPNRGDCLSVYGVARDLAVALELDLNEKKNFKESENALGIGRILRLGVTRDLNSLLMYRAFELKEKLHNKLLINLRLAQAELLSQNPIENLLNYATHSTGVLFNAYDFDKLKKNNDELNFTLDKEEQGESKISCQEELLSISGIYQNANSKCDEKTKIVIVEAHYTDPSVIAQSKGKYKEVDEKTFYRSFRGSEPKLGVGMDFLLQQIATIQDIMIYSSSQQVLDYKKEQIITISIETINNTIGQNIDKDEILKILKKLGFELLLSNDGLINIKVPLHRSDIKNIFDICEEIVRIIGIDNIISKGLEFVEKNHLNQSYKDYKELLNLRQNAVNSGYFESLHYVLDNKKELEIFGFDKLGLKLINPITEELNTLRSTLLNQLLNAASLNAKNSQKIIKLFQSGAVFNAKNEELHHIAFIHSGFKEEAKIANKAKPALVNFYDFLLDMRNILGTFELKTSNFSFLSPYEQAYIYKNNQKIGFLGRVHLNLETQKDLAKSYICELDLKLLKNEPKTAKPYSKFPKVSRDLSILAPKNFPYENIKEAIQKLKLDLLENFRLIDIYSDENLKDLYSLTLSFNFKSFEKTLEDKEVNLCLDTILKALEELGLKLR